MGSDSRGAGNNENQPDDVRHVLCIQLFVCFTTPTRFAFDDFLFMRFETKLGSSETSLAAFFLRNKIDIKVISFLLFIVSDFFPFPLFPFRSPHREKGTLLLNVTAWLIKSCSAMNSLPNVTRMTFTGSLMMITHLLDVLVELHRPQLADQNRHVNQIRENERPGPQHDVGPALREV